MKKRILYLDIIKVFALLFVIFNHTDDILISSYMYIRIIHNSLFYLSKSAVPLFLMVSGALLIDKKDSIPKLIKRIIRVLIPLIIITIIWSLTHAKEINILNMLDNTIKSTEDIEKGFDIPVLVTIPLIESFENEKGGNK